MSDPTRHPESASRAVHCFGRFELDTAARRLQVDGVPVALGSRAFDLLALLAQHAPQPVTSDALQRAVWSERRVGANNVRVQIAALRKLLGDGVIEHQATRGYRLVLPVSRIGDDATPAPQPPANGNLPHALPPLFGRDRERAALREQLGGPARLTIAGPAGMGKTLLALAVAHDRRHDHADGVWWIDLAPLTDGTQIAERVASAIGVRLGGGDAGAQAAALAHALDRRELLLVLDNAEHLVGAVCHLADSLLRHAPKVALLATSRRSLKFAGEQLHRLGSLTLPDAPGLAAARRSAAVAVFEARARRADPAFALTEANAEAVVDICRQLDGVALAIVLAAARVPLLGVAGLRERLTDRLRLLASREPDARGHPQALSAALDWSHGLLPPIGQALLRRLGVFAGSFALESVQAVLGGLPKADDSPAGQALDDWAVLDALNALLDHSLLMPETAALQGTAAARYRLHESLRLYAAEHLAVHPEAPALRERHARHMLARVTGQPGLAGDDDPPGKRMDQTLADADHDNLRAAIAWAIEHDTALALRLAAQSNAYFRLRCHHLEARQLHAKLLADPRTATHPRRLARVHLALAALCFEQNDLGQTLAHGQAAGALLEREPDAQAQGEAHGWIGAAQHGRRDFPAADVAYRQSMRYHAAGGHLNGVADQLNNLGLVMVELGEHLQARTLLNEALALHQRNGSDWGTAIALENLGEAAYVAGDLLAAQGHWQQALPRVRQLGHLYHEALILQYLGQVQRRLGQLAEARAHLRLSLSISRPQRLQGLVCDAIALLAGVALDSGHAYRAGVLLQASERLRSSELIGPMAVDLPAIRAGVRNALAENDWHAARAEGDRLQPEEVQA